MHQKSCRTSTLCIRNMSDIHAMYWESYYYVTNILICCDRCIAVKFGQMPIHSVQVPIHASEICRTSMVFIRNMSDIHAMYWESYYYVTNILICCDRCIAVKFGQMPIHSVQVPIHASEICRTSMVFIRNMSDIHAMYWESYYYVTNILICCDRCIAVKFGQMPIHSVQVPIHASEICRTSMVFIRNMSDIHAMYWESYYYVTNILICCDRCIAVKFGQMPIHSVQVPIHASEICRTSMVFIRNMSDIHAMYWESYYYVTNILICCDRCIAVKFGQMPIHSVQVPIHASEICRTSMVFIRNMSDIHAMYWESYYYVTNILICCDRCIAVKFGQMPIHSVQVPIHASEICRTSMVFIRNMSDIHAMYWESYYYVTNILICCDRCIAVKFGQMPIHSVQVPIHASEICRTSMVFIRNMSDIHAMYWESYYYVTNILICCDRCIAVKFGQMPIHSVQVPIHASEICRTSMVFIRNMSDIHAMYWESYYYVTNILICCDRCIAVKFGQMPIHSVQVPIHASEICRTSMVFIRNMSDIHAMYWESYYYVTNILICCDRCIAVKFGQMPIHSVQVPIHASEICRTSMVFIRNMSDIHAMYLELYYYVTNILICCGRCIAVKFGQMPIHSVQVPIRASEICRTSMLCIGNHTTMLPIY